MRIYISSLSTLRRVCVNSCESSDNLTWKNVPLRKFQSALRAFAGAPAHPGQLLPQQQRHASCCSQLQQLQSQTAPAWRYQSALRAPQVFWSPIIATCYYNVALKSTILTSATLTAFGARPGVDFVLGLGGSTSAMPKRSARALRFSNSSSAEVAGADTTVLGASEALLTAFWIFDCGLA